MQVGCIVLLAAIGIYFLYYVIRYFIKDYPEVKAREKEERLVTEILNGFDIRGERARILTLLGNSLPEAYRCGRRHCGGILLKDPFLGGHYVCSRCGNVRLTIRNVKRVS